MKRLQQQGIVCISIDTTAIVTQDITPQQWYGGLIRSLVNSLNLSEKINLRNWLREREYLSPVQFFTEFIEQVLIVQVSTQIVIFIDEIDSLLNVSFKDDFFAAIRACWNKRAENQKYQRLTFALLGVATPSDLIQDKKRTPFNIGKAIELTGFQLEEAQPLAQGLAAIGNPQALMRSLLEWTGGQPFLTQKVCQLVLAEGKVVSPGEEAVHLETLVREGIIKNWESQDEPEHLRTIRDRIMHSGEKRTGILLGLCQQIVSQGAIDADDSLEQMELRLTGLVVKRDGKLKIYNRIYLEVFKEEWCNRILASLRPYNEAFQAWVASNYQDDSRLLRGENLQAALTWSVGKSLSSQDYQFLAACQEVDKQEAIEDTKKQADLILEKATNKAKQQIRLGFILMSSGVLLGLILFVLTPFIARVFNNIGYGEYEKGKYQKAIDYYDLAIMTQPSYPMPAYNRGLAYEKMNNYAGARLSYETAIEKEFSPAYNNLAYLYISRDKNYSKGIKLLEIGKTKSTQGLFPSYKVQASIYKNLGWAQFEMKQYDQAESNLRLSIEERDDLISSHCLLAKVLVAKNQPAKNEWQKCKDNSKAVNPHTIKAEEKIWIQEAEKFLKVNN